MPVKVSDRRHLATRSTGCVTRSSPQISSSSTPSSNVIVETTPKLNATETVQNTYRERDAYLQLCSRWLLTAAAASSSSSSCTSSTLSTCIKQTSTTTPSSGITNTNEPDGLSSPPPPSTSLLISSSPSTTPMNSSAFLWPTYSANLLEYTKSILSSIYSSASSSTPSTPNPSSTLSTTTTNTTTNSNIFNNNNLILSICQEESKRNINHMYSCGLYVQCLKERLLTDFKYGFGTGRDRREGDIKRRLRPNPRKRRFPDMIKHKPKPQQSSTTISQNAKKVAAAAAAVLMRSTLGKRNLFPQRGGGGNKKRGKTTTTTLIETTSGLSSRGVEVVPNKRKRYQQQQHSSASEVSGEEDATEMLDNDEEHASIKKSIHGSGAGVGGTNVTATTSKHGRPLRGQGVDKKVLDWKFCYQDNKRKSGNSSTAATGEGSVGGSSNNYKQSNKFKSSSSQIPNDFALDIKIGKLSSSPSKLEFGKPMQLSSSSSSSATLATAASSLLKTERDNRLSKDMKILAALRNKKAHALKRPPITNNANFASSTTKDKVRNYLIRKQSTEASGSSCNQTSGGSLVGNISTAAANVISSGQMHTTHHNTESSSSTITQSPKSNKKSTYNISSGSIGGGGGSQTMSTTSSTTTTLGGSGGNNNNNSTTASSTNTNNNNTTLPDFVPPCVRELLKGLRYRCISRMNEKAFWIRGIPRKDFNLFSTRYGQGKNSTCDIFHLSIHEENSIYVYDVLMEQRTNPIDNVNTTASSSAGGVLSMEEADDKNKGGKGNEKSIVLKRNVNERDFLSTISSSGGDLDNIQDADAMLVGRDVVVEASPPPPASTPSQTIATSTAQPSSFSTSFHQQIYSSTMSTAAGGAATTTTSGAGAGGVSSIGKSTTSFLAPAPPPPIMPTSIDGAMTTIRFRRPLPPSPMKQVRRVYTKNPTCPAILNRNRRKAAIPAPMNTQTLGFSFTNPPNQTNQANVRISQASIMSSGMNKSYSTDSSGFMGRPQGIMSSAANDSNNKTSVFTMSANSTSVIRPPNAAAQPWLLSPSLRAQMSNQQQQQHQLTHFSQGVLVSTPPRFIHGMTTNTSSGGGQHFIMPPRTGGVVSGSGTPLGNLQPPQTTLLPSAYNLQSQRRGTWQVSKPTKSSSAPPPPPKTDANSSSANSAAPSQ